MSCISNKLSKRYPQSCWNSCKKLIQKWCKRLSTSNILAWANVVVWQKRKPKISMWDRQTSLCLFEYVRFHLNGKLSSCRCANEIYQYSVRLVWVLDDSYIKNMFFLKFIQLVLKFWIIYKNVYKTSKKINTSGLGNA